MVMTLDLILSAMGACHLLLDFAAVTTKSQLPTTATIDDKYCEVKSQENP